MRAYHALSTHTHREREREKSVRSHLEVDPARAIEITDLKHAFDLLARDGGVGQSALDAVAKVLRRDELPARQLVVDGLKELHAR